MTELKTMNALAGKRIFITGTSGFVGKVVLEKLLRSVPTVDHIYILLRGNRKFPTAQVRFNEDIAKSTIFERLSEELGGLEDKQTLASFCKNRVSIIEGELTEHRFGLGEKEFAELAQNVDIIINSAASVNFREALDKALKINTLCLKNIIALSKSGGNCPVVQVSTCYVNGYNTGLMEEENVEPVGPGIEKSAFGYYEVEPLIEMMQSKITLVENSISSPEEREQALIDLGIEEANHYGWNDTYTLTKWMGEQLLMKELYGGTLTILRPSIVESTLSGPKPGWVEGIKVADAIIMAYAREKVTFFPGKKNGVLDIIPADLVSNSIILSAAEMVLEPGKQRIYQCASSEVNPLKLKRMVDLVQAEAEQNYEKHDRLFYRKPQRPFVMVPRPVFKVGSSAAQTMMKVGSKVLGFIGKEPNPRTIHNIEATLKLSLIFSFYTVPRYTFSNAKLLDLADRMGDADKEEFPVDASEYDWEYYIRDVHIPGLNKYALRPRRRSSSEKEGLPQNVSEGSQPA